MINSIAQNPFAKLRMRNILSDPSQVPDPTDKVTPGSLETPPPNTGQDYRDASDDSNANSDDQYFKDMQRIRGYAPVTSQYRDALLHAPEMKNYEPSKMRRLGAALTGFAGGYASRNPSEGAALADRINDAPYEKAKTDYEMKTSTLGRGSTLEQSDIENQVKNMAQARALGLSYAKFAQQRAHETNTDTAALETAGARVTSANKKEYTPVQMSTGVRMVNKNDKTDYYDLPGKTMAMVNADIANGRLKTDQKNANTNAGRLQLQTDNSAKKDITDRYKLWQGDQKIKLANKGVKPIDQDRARTLTLREMASDPVFGKYIDTTTNPNYPEVKQGLNPAKFQALTEELTKRTGQKLGLTQDDINELLQDDNSDDDSVGDIGDSEMN